MISDQEFVVSSLELHLFFGRIMKEHSLFLEAGFTPKNKEQAQMADRFKAAFENILHNAIQLSSGIISNDVIRSGELVTDFTRGSEQKTQNFTAIPINQDLTVMESRLYGSDRPNITPALVESIRMLNSKTAPVLDRLIDFKTGLLNDVLSCNMFTVNYPLLIDHILREAKLYRSHLRALESGRSLEETTKSMELFWNQIMLEHALFIRGLLDPSEGELINTANTLQRSTPTCWKAPKPQPAAWWKWQPAKLWPKPGNTAISRLPAQKELQNAKFVLSFCRFWQTMCFVKPIITSACWSKHHKVILFLTIKSCPVPSMHTGQLFYCFAIKIIFEKPSHINGLQAIGKLYLLTYTASLPIR